MFPKEILQENREMNQLFEILDHSEKMSTGEHMAHLMEHLEKKIKDRYIKIYEIKKKKKKTIINSR